MAMLPYALNAGEHRSLLVYGAFLDSRRRSCGPPELPLEVA